MVEKKLNLILISRIQDRRGKQYLMLKNRKCIGCDNLLIKTQIFQKIENLNIQVFSEETAYQMVSILSGLLREALQKNLNLLMFL